MLSKKLIFFVYFKLIFFDIFIFWYDDIKIDFKK